MNELKLSPNEAIFYEYDPEKDRLSIRLQADDVETSEEPIANLPHVSLSRDRTSGEVVGVAVASVQSLLLERLVRDIFFQTLPLMGANVTPAPSGAAGAQQAPSPVAPPPVPGPEGWANEGVDSVVAPVAETAGDEPVEESVPEPPLESPPRRRRGRQEKQEARVAPVSPAGEEQEETAIAAAPADERTDEESVEIERPARKRKRRKRRRKPQKEVAEAVPEVEGQEVAAAVPGVEMHVDSSGKPTPIPGLGAPEAFEFMGMHPYLGQVISVMGFEEPTPIQRRAVPRIMEGRDVIGLSQTGSGKTLAFLIPAMHRLLEEESQGHQPRLLVLTPTRELAVQVADEAELLATYTNLRVTTIYGGVSMQKQIQALRRGVDVIVATPGRLLDHIRRKNVKLDQIRIVVLDEADRMLDMGFLPDIRTIISTLPRKRQTLLFSATMPPPIESLSLDFQRDPDLIEVARRVPPESIKQFLYPVERHLKTPLLLHLLKQDETMSRVLVFVETKAESDILARKLREAGISVDLMHGDRSQKERELALEKLRDNRVRVLVATNVAARGLDIQGISHIVNYDMPDSVDSYVHRIGRTARGDEEGQAITFVAFTDQGMVKRIESALERELPRVKVEGFNYDVPPPSWAKPSAEEIIDRLTQPQGLAERFKRMMGRRR